MTILIRNIEYTKTCKTCGKTKDISQFKKKYHVPKNVTISLYKDECISCKNKKSSEAIEKKRAFRWGYIHSIPKFSKCIKCGEERLHLLQYHHVFPENKVKSISDLVSSGFCWDFHVELEKVVCLCSNCHFDYHHLDRIAEEGLSLSEYVPGFDINPFIRPKLPNVEEYKRYLRLKDEAGIPRPRRKSIFGKYDPLGTFD